MAIQWRIWLSTALLFLVALILCWLPLPSQAGVFNLSRFVMPGQFAVGLEPEFTFSNGAGMGMNFKYTHGVNELSNLGVVVGTGAEGRGFRLGGIYSFDFFPDTSGQPGIGLATQMYYYRVQNETGQFEATAVPYIHKTFQTSSTEFEPFVAVPFGMAFSTGSYETIWTMAVGSIIRASDHLRYVVELGIAINNSSSYFSGGLTYYH